MTLLVFKTSVSWLSAGMGGFDSHTPPPMHSASLKIPSWEGQKAQPSGWVLPVGDNPPLHPSRGKDWSLDILRSNSRGVDPHPACGHPLPKGEGEIHGLER
ncbi:MAG: hypothetical protein DMG06_08070 [Acidobacteria bacterium]|nr:MAG: hypothetical protein DMG06_08070 [Acidobacteriota bacterium]